MRIGSENGHKRGRHVARYILAIVVILLWCASTVPAFAQVAYDQEKKRMTFGEKPFTWEEFRSYYAEICKRNIIAMSEKTRLKNFRIIAPEGLSDEDVCSISDDILFAMQGAYYYVGSYMQEEKVQLTWRIPQPVLEEGLKRVDPNFTPATVFVPVQTPDIPTLVKLLDKLRTPDSYVREFGDDRIIIVDDQDYIERMVTLIKALDSPSTSTKVFLWTPKYSAVEDVKNIVEQLFKPERKQSELDALLVDERTNQLIIKGPEAACRKVLEIAPKFDVAIRAEEELEVVRLAFQQAEELSSVISNIATSTGRSTKKTNKREFGEDLDVKVSADKATNSILLVGSPRGIEEMKSLIERLDRFPKQVFLETMLLEMTLTDDVSSGLSVAAIKGVGNDSQIVAGTNYGGLSAANLNPASLMGLAVGTVGPDSGKDGEALNLGSDFPSFAAVIQALETTSRVKVLSNPFLLGADGEDAEIVVGSNVPYITGSSRDSNNRPVLSIQRQDVALTLKLKPEINQGNRVKMKVDITIEDMTSQSETLGPTTSKRAMKTVSIGKSGEKIVIGGLIRNVTGEDIEKVPLMGDVPIVGRLFRTESDRDEKTSLLVFITPHIIENMETLKTIFKRKIKERREYVTQSYGSEIEDYDVPQDLHDRVGLIEAIRQIIEEERLELEKSRPKEKVLVITPSKAPEPEAPDNETVENLDLKQDIEINPTTPPPPETATPPERP